MAVTLVGQVFGDTGTAGWNLHTGNGDRFFDRAIVFQTPLIGTPIIQANLAAIDSDATPNLRVELLVTNVTSTGFTLRIHAWADTRLFRVRANWLAVSP